MLSLVGECDKACLDACKVNNMCERVGQDFGSDWALEWVVMGADIASHSHDS